jgi:hypothetical protein
MQETIRIYYKDRQKHVDSQILISTAFIDETNSDSKKHEISSVVITWSTARP